MSVEPRICLFSNISNFLSSVDVILFIAMEFDSKNIFHQNIFKYDWAFQGVALSEKKKADVVLVKSTCLPGPSGPDWRDSQSSIHRRLTQT